MGKYQKNLFLLYMKNLLKKRNLILIIISLIVILSIIYFFMNTNIEKFQQIVMYNNNNSNGSSVISEPINKDSLKIDNKNNMETYIQQTDTIINSDKEKLNNYLQQCSSLFKMLHTNIDDKDFNSFDSNTKKINDLFSENILKYILENETINSNDQINLIIFLEEVQNVGRSSCTDPPECHSLSHSDITNMQKILFANP
jgi:hypothetical protein